MSSQHNLELKKGNTGKVSWKSPSNLALVKYWGKYGQQLPQNPSLSFTLKNAHTITSLSYEVLENPGSDIRLSFLFDNESKPAFAEKIKKFLASITGIYPFINQVKFDISSSNSFPHSSGIASSASAMSALGLCLVSLEEQLFDIKLDTHTFFEKASNIARLGSGSASRSVFPKLGLWGKTPSIEKSSNLYAIPFFKELDPIFHTFHDDILIVSESEKSVSSTAGHQLMNGNIYADNRYLQANQRIEALIKAMKEGNLDIFGQIVENEALTLHALMMCSEPSYILMEGTSIELIKKIRAFRKETGLHVYFSLDAGPNIHLLYPDHQKDKIQTFVQSDLSPYCKKILPDMVGNGPIRID